MFYGRGVDHEHKQPATFSTLEQAAFRVGVPKAWLRQEAEAGRIPHLRAGRTIMFNIETVEKALLERASKAVAHAR